MFPCGGPSKRGPQGHLWHENVRHIPRIETADIAAKSIRAHLSARDFNLEELAGNWSLNADVGAIDSPNENLVKALPGTQTLIGNGTLTPEKLTVSSLKFANSVLSANLAANYLD